MKLSEAQLSALVAIVREGSFERAARSLHITPSAVSQRIKLLEEEIGSVLVTRGTPCVTTAIGESIYRHALQVELLERELMAIVAPMNPALGDTAFTVPIAVNADSLATWIMPALAAFTEATGACLEVSSDDQDHTAALLRSGKVLGVVTSQASAVQGCRVQPLGVMRYRATASRAFIRRWFQEGVNAKTLARAPALAYDRKDRLCESFLIEQLGLKVPELRPSFVPSPTAYIDATILGLGWGMNPEGLVASALKRRRLVELCPDRWLDVPLYWQQWSLSSRTIDALARALVEHAEASLQPLNA